MKATAHTTRQADLENELNKVKKPDRRGANFIVSQAQQFVVTPS
jgi:hypothetical protein